MDSLSQIVLGAAVGEAASGRRLGRRALAWGALAGTLPDLDVLASPFLTAPEALQMHRGLTHSVFFAFVAAPLFGGLTAWLHRRFGRTNHPGGEAVARARPWIALWFWGMWTHPMLDALTNYGTQLLWPVSRHPFAVSSVFIIDLAYTLPLLVACVVAWRARSDAGRRLRAVAWGLALSTAYLGVGLAVQGYVKSVADASLRALRPSTGPVTRVLVEPGGPSALLWTVIAETMPPPIHGWGSAAPRAPDPIFHVGTLSLLDPRPYRVAFQPLGGRHDRVAGLDGEGIDALRWFTKGWYSVRPAPGDSLDVCDLRFGRTDGYQARGDAPCVFTFRLAPDGATFRQARPEFDVKAALSALWRRTRGEPPAWTLAPTPPR